MQPEHLMTAHGVTVFPAPRDLETHRVLVTARDHLAANVMWSYLIEMARAGVPVTLQSVHDVAEGVRSGVLPDRALESIRGPLSLVHQPFLTSA